MKRNTTPVVDAITEMHHAGNIVNPLWIRWIKEHNPDEKAESKSMACTAALVLSDILYWYRASVIRDETTGAILEVKKRFKADKLQRSYDAIADQWGISKRQAQRAVYLLRDVGLITIETRTITSQGVRIPNVVFMEPVPENVIKAGQISGQNRTEDVPKSENGLTKKGKTSSQKRSDKYIDYSENSQESTHSLTTTERPKKKASSSSEGESASLDGESLDQARKVAAYLAGCEYWGDDGVKYHYRNTSGLVKACKGHTEQSATNAMIAANEFMDGQHRKGLDVGTPQGILCRALKENWQPSALAESKHESAMKEQLRQLSQAEQADYTVEWLGLMEKTGCIQDVQIDRLTFSYTFRYHDDPTFYAPSLDTLPPKYQHVTITHIREALNQRVAA
jgi:hypothetical protein